MKATLFEFRNRRWFIITIFFLAFAFDGIDHQQSGGAIAQWPALHCHEGSALAWTRGVFIFAAVMLVLSAALRNWGTSYLKTAVMQSRQVHTERLLGDGPFRHVRNPLYLGNLLMAVGVGLVTSRIGFIFLLVAMTVFHYRLIFREEAELSATQGESYRAYCARVPRLWFSLVPRIPSAGNQPHWLNGISGELFHWAIAVGGILYAITLNGRIYWEAFLVSLLPGIWYRFREAHNRPQPRS